MPTRVNKQIIQIVSDRQTAQQTEQAVQRMRDRFAGLQSQLDRARSSMEAQRAVTQEMARSWLEAARPAAGLERVNTNLVQSETQLRAAVLETAGALRSKMAAEEAAERVSQRTLRAQRESIRTAGRLSYGVSGIATFAGSVGGAGVREPLAVGSQLINAARGLEVLKMELPDLANKAATAAGGTKTLALGLGAVGIGLAAAAFVAGQLKDAADKAAEATRRWIEATRRYYEFDPASKTTEQVEAEVQALQRSIDTRERELTTLDLEIQKRDAARNGAEKFLGTLGIETDGLDELRERREELAKEQEAELILLGSLHAALRNNTSAAADLLELEEELAEKRREASRQIVEYIRERTQREIEMAQRSRDWSSEQAEKRLDDIAIERGALEEQRAALERLAEAGIDVAGETDIVNEKLAALGIEERALRDDIIPLIAAREREAEMAERVRKAFEDGVAASEKYTAALEQFNEETARIEEDRQRTEIRELEDWALKRTRALAEHYRDLASIDAKYYQKRDELIASIAEDTSGDNQEALDRLRDFNKQQRREAEDHRDRLLKIERDRRKGIQAAAAQLDAIALLNAQEQAEEALTDEQQQYEKEKRRREEDFRDRMHLLDRERQERRRANEQALRDLRTQYERERAERIADFNRKAAEEAQDRAIRLQRQQEDWDREDRLRQQQFDQAYEETRKQYNRIRLAAKNALVDIENNFGSVLGRIAANIRSQLGTGSTAGIRQYQLGGEVGRTGLIGAHVGEEVLRAEVARPLRSLMGGRIDQRALLSMAGQMNVSVPVMINLGAGTGRNPFESAAAQRELQHAIERTVVRFVEGRAGGLLGL
ncbi:MAG: hypothetical protein KO463_01085 [Candidatus Methanofastidiosa archaeon]|nr:hypothetical protein [Candidatus Methanofastidiosa archaeon]